MVVYERIGNGYILEDPKFIKRFRIGLSTYNVVSGIESAWRMKEFENGTHIPFGVINIELKGV